MKVKNRAIGSVCELVAHGAGKYITEFAVESEDGSEIATYSTIEELLEYWETYKPTEPLIKDKKIRKALQAWAEACEIESDDAIMVSGLAPAFTRFYTSMYEIDIKTESSLELDEHRDYVIAELCGAPEPLEPTFIDLDERIKEKEEE